MLTTRKFIGARNIVSIAIVLLLAACNGQAPNDDAMNDSIITEPATFTDESKNITYSLPSPLKIASIFKKSGLKYKDGVTSPLKDPDKYTTNLSKALNLGVYSADLSYAILNKQNQVAVEYMQLSRKLGDRLGMGVIYEKNNLLKRFENNIGKDDSLAHIISELQMITDMYLDENNQKQITSIVFAGAWIESLYIATQVHGTGDEKAFNDKFTEQMRILESIINALKAEEKKDDNISKLIADLQEIKNNYDDLLSSKSKPDVTENELSEDPTLTGVEVVFLAKKIEALRTKFING